MLILDKHLLKLIQGSDRITAFKDGPRHFLTVYPIKDRWDTYMNIDVPGSRVIQHASLPIGPFDAERGQCAACLEHTARDVFQLLRVGDGIALEWWPDNNSPWLDKRGLTSDMLRLLVDRPIGKDRFRRLELHLEERTTGEDNARIRFCKGFPKPRREQDAA